MAEDIGAVLAHRLLAYFKEPQHIFNARRGELESIPGIKQQRIRSLLDSALERAAIREVECARAAGIELISLEHPDYPVHLKSIEYPPLVLWISGRIKAEDRLALAIVGPRSPSPYARQMVERVGHELAAKGLTLVSGLAYGIDADVHRTALKAGGRTLGVIGQGLGTPIYPGAHQDLARQIVGEDRGALISIFPMETKPGPGLFPIRNEVIAGLCLGTLVVEASERSGSLITARHAAAAGRTVMACPGDATRKSAQGSNRLIGDGAVLVQKAEDVLAALEEELRREMKAIKAGMAALGNDGNLNSMSTEPHRAEIEKPERFQKSLPTDLLATTIGEILAHEPLPIDVILSRCIEAGFDSAQVQSRLLELEIEGVLRQFPGRVYALDADFDEVIAD